MRYVSCISTSDLQLARCSLNERLVAARTAERGAVHRLAVLLWEMADRALYRVLGYTSIHRYAAVALDLTARVARDLLRIGRRLPELPALNAKTTSDVAERPPARPRAGLSWPLVRGVPGRTRNRPNYKHARAPRCQPGVPAGLSRSKPLVPNGSPLVCL